MIMSDTLIESEQTRMKKIWGWMMLLMKVLTYEQIAQATGLALDDVQKLSNEIVSDVETVGQ